MYRGEEKGFRCQFRAKRDGIQSPKDAARSGKNPVCGRRGKGCRRQRIQCLLRGGSMPFRGLHKPGNFAGGPDFTLWAVRGAPHCALLIQAYCGKAPASCARRAPFRGWRAPRASGGDGAETENRPGGPRAAAASAGFCHGHAAVFAPGRPPGGFTVTRPARRGTGCIRPEWVCRNPRCPPSRRWSRPAPAPVVGCL